MSRKFECALGFADRLLSRVGLVQVRAARQGSTNQFLGTPCAQPPYANILGPGLDASFHRLSTVPVKQGEQPTLSAAKDFTQNLSFSATMALPVFSRQSRTRFHLTFHWQPRR